MQVGEERDASGAGEFTLNPTERVQAAVRGEHERVRAAAVEEPETERGRSGRPQASCVPLPTARVDFTP